MIGPLLVAKAERVEAVPTLSLGSSAKVTVCSAGITVTTAADDVVLPASLLM